MWRLVSISAQAQDGVDVCGVAQTSSTEWKLKATNAAAPCLAFRGSHHFTAHCSVGDFDYDTI